jgi:subtilase family serine protease
MSQRRGLPESEAAAAVELLSLREEINDLTLDEDRLKLQVMELRSQIASYEPAAQRSQSGPASDAGPLVSGPLGRLAALQAQLDDAQEQLAHVAAQKAALVERQQATQKRLMDLRARHQRDASWRHASPRWEKGSDSRRERSQKPLVVLLCGVLLVALVGMLIHFAHFSALDLSLLANSSSHSGQAAPPEVPPFFTPAKTAPTNQGCVTTIKDSCYSPEYIQQAFGLTPLYREGFDGRGQTIVILGAGATDTLKADLHTFDVAWGLPDPPNFDILYPDGPPAPYTCPGGVDRLQYENTLAVEWAHAVAPGANIVLVIGANKVSSTKTQENCAQVSIQQDLKYVLDHSLGTIISTSYGSSEAGNASDTPAQKAAAQKYLAAGHQLLERAAAAHVTVVAASGDSGATNPNNASGVASYWPTPNVSWPASDPDALAVGGTSLTLGNEAHDDAYVHETAWNDPPAGASGGGLSAIFPEPTYQQTVPDQSLFQGKRGVPDVSFPAADLLIYASAEDGALVKANPEWQHWDLADGTSIAASCWAGLIAIANQMHGQPLGLVQPALYQLQGQAMHDITSGDNSFANVQGYPATKGYDLVTGWGTPIANNFLPALLRAADQIAAAATPSPTTTPQSQ